jgi:hypothetical protein
MRTRSAATRARLAEVRGHGGAGPAAPSPRRAVDRRRRGVERDPEDRVEDIRRRRERRYRRQGQIVGIEEDRERHRGDDTGDDEALVDVLEDGVDLGHLARQHLDRARVFVELDGVALLVEPRRKAQAVLARRQPHDAPRRRERPEDRRASRPLLALELDEQAARPRGAGLLRVVVGEDLEGDAPLSVVAVGANSGGDRVMPRLDGQAGVEQQRCDEQREVWGRR